MGAAKVKFTKDWLNEGGGSTMSGERLKPFAEVVSFKPSKRSIKGK